MVEIILEEVVDMEIEQTEETEREIILEMVEVVVDIILLVVDLIELMQVEEEDHMEMELGPIGLLDMVVVGAP